MSFPSDFSTAKIFSKFNHTDSQTKTRTLQKKYLHCNLRHAVVQPLLTVPEITGRAWWLSLQRKSNIAPKKPLLSFKSVRPCKIRSSWYVYQLQDLLNVPLLHNQKAWITNRSFKKLTANPHPSAQVPDALATLERAGTSQQADAEEPATRHELCRALRQGAPTVRSDLWRGARQG